MEQQQRGVLYPQHLPTFTRLPAPGELAHAVRWFWIPEWQLGPGVTLRQEILPFPACNLVVEPAAITAVGPPTRRSERVLTGTGWAVGALLRPAATTLLPSLGELRDRTVELDEPELHAAVVAAMTQQSQRHEAAVAALARWITQRVPRATPSGALANELEEALADPTLLRVAELEARLHISVRTLQRIAARYFGLSLHSMIRRRRLQEAAQRLRDDPTVPLAEVAGELGYADHAHFTTDFTAVLGLPPSAYREQVQQVTA